MRIFLGLAVAAALAVTPIAAEADHWTAVCSTGAVDESSQSHYAFSGAVFEYNVASVSLSPIVERINVVNTSDGGTNPEQPGWTKLEITYTEAVASDSVSASLYEVDPCTGATELLCTATSGGAGTACRSCTIPGVIDFASHAYYVVVSVDRAATGNRPKCHMLRLY